MATSYGGSVVWGLILVIGVLTFLIRLSFIGLFGYLDDIPPQVERGLRFVPAAVLAALVLPAFVTPEAGASGVPVDKIVAGIVASGFAWRTESVFVTIVAGMTTLWVVRFVLLPVF